MVAVNDIICEGGLVSDGITFISIFNQIREVVAYLVKRNSHTPAMYLWYTTHKHPFFGHKIISDSRHADGARGSVVG
jgi:hypothetical protein